MAFRKAAPQPFFLRLAITGPPGSGKTFTAMQIAKHISSGRDFGIIDTEKHSTDRYSRFFSYGVDYLDPPFTVDRYIQSLREGVEAGFPVLILDSFSHAWNGEGGILEKVDQIAAASKSRNTFNAWKDATPLQNRLVNTLIGLPVHLIVTMRTKIEYAIDDDGKGKKAPRKIGTAPVQRDGLEYEFDIVLEMDQSTGIITKTRCFELAGAVIHQPGQAFAQQLLAWTQAGQPAQAGGVAPATSPQAATTELLTAPDQNPAPAKPGLPTWYRDFALNLIAGHQGLTQHYAGITDDEHRAKQILRDLRDRFGLKTAAELQTAQAYLLWATVQPADPTADDPTPEAPQPTTDAEPAPVPA